MSGAHGRHGFAGLGSEGRALSQDKPWDQWNFTPPAGEPAKSPASPDEPAAAPAGGADAVDSEALAAWLKSDDVLNDTPLPVNPPGNPAELAAMWPPTAPVDPFSGIKTPGGSSTGGEWDLDFGGGAPAGAGVGGAPAPGVGEFDLGG